MDERPDLPPRFEGGVEERAGQLGSGDVLDRDAPAVNALERLYSLRREPRRVAIEFDGLALREDGGPVYLRLRIRAYQGHRRHDYCVPPSP
jgi:hypothetical protein